MSDVRLSESEIETIKRVVRQFDPQAKIILFGSRTDLSKKGGDIDLLVISDKIDYNSRRNIKTELYLLLGDRKIDLIVTDNPDKQSFTKIAYKYGVEL
ncbi:MAG: nucleotidyltransferase domain-containing protein [Hydrogenothermaceae bacterium]|nr:nucleotidyltransferase domain-containing protein [Hydrogenothermaceae bacterium]